MSGSNYEAKLIASIPPALLKTLPAGQPPPDTQPDFAHPQTRVPVIVGVDIAFLVLAIFCFSIRIYTKVTIAKNWKWDDFTCSLGFICSIVFFVAVVIGCINGAIGRHMWDVHLDKVLGNSNLYQDYIQTIMVTPALGLIKCSLFIQYYLLFRPFRWVRISVWIGAIMSAVFYVAVTVIALILESPWPGESILEDVLSNHFLDFPQLSIPTGVIGMLVDWYLLILPIPAVLALQLSTARKLGVLIVFMTGGLAAIASIVSLYYRVQLQVRKTTSDPTWNNSYVVLWAQIEMFAGVAASSMPTVHQFFGRQNFSLTPFKSSLKSKLMRQPSGSARAKLPDHNPSFTDWGGSYTHIWKDCEGFRMKDLESDGCERVGARALPVEVPQIHLRQDIFVMQEHRDDAAFRPSVPGHKL